LHAVLNGAATAPPTASEHGPVQADVGLRRLYFGTGRRGGEFPTDWMTASGRLPVATNGCSVDAISPRALTERRAALEKPGRHVWVGTRRPRSQGAVIQLRLVANDHNGACVSPALRGQEATFASGQTCGWVAPHCASPPCSGGARVAAFRRQTCPWLQRLCRSKVMSRGVV
jgi:hypothetical protein